MPSARSNDPAALAHDLNNLLLAIVNASEAAEAGLSGPLTEQNAALARSGLQTVVLAAQQAATLARAIMRDIDPAIQVNASQTFYLPETRDRFDFRAYDYVVDCIDTVTGKLDLVMQCRAAGTPIISALGTGNKLDPTKLVLSDLSETSVCPLARIMRKELRRRGVEHLKVVWSREEPIEPRFQPEPEEAEPEAAGNLNDAGPAASPEAYGNKRRSVPGSSPFVPPAAGLIIASAVIRDLLSL